MKVLKISTNDWRHDSRDYRELSVCKELGMGVIVIAKKNKDDPDRDVVKGFDVIRLTTTPIIKDKASAINKVASFFLWIRYVRKMKVDVISGHDIEGLLIGYLAFKFKRHKPAFVYDSHEFEMGRHRYYKKPLKKFLMKRIEKKLIKKSKFTIAVNDCIADKISSIHKCKRPIVVRSTPNKWKIDTNLIAEERKEILGYFGINDGFIVMYHGCLCRYRGIENMLKAIQNTENTYAVVLGSGEDSYLETLKRLISELKMERRVYIHEAVSNDELYKYVGAANVGMANIEPICDSYYYSLPNKFFENIQSLTPIIASSFPEMESIITKYDIGLLCDPQNIDDISKKIELMKDNSVYNKFKKNIVLAKEELCWEKEKEVLLNAYSDLLNR